MLKIQIIIGSTREGRAGETVGKWVFTVLSKHTDINAELIDLRDYPLPFFDDPISPSVVKEYTNPQVKLWAKKIGEGDAYIIVTPEYNHGYTAVLKNALDYIYYPWNNKAIAFISYGYSANGSRAVEQLRQIVIELQMAPIRNSVHLSLMPQPFSKEGEMLIPHYNNSLEKLFSQLFWWAKALQNARRIMKKTAK
jgi:NAD(P)H-dependent FMN reductase